MKKALLSIIILTFSIATTFAQPKSRIQQAEAKAETTLSERAKAQYTGQMPTPENVVWKRGIYRTLDLTKEKNAALYYPVEPLGDQCNLFTLIIRLVAEGKVPVYEYRSDGNELFTESNRYKVSDLLDKFYIPFEEKTPGQYTINDYDIPSAQVLSYFIKESTYYDQRTATNGTRVTALCPVLHGEGDYGSEVTKYPMFWLNYDDISIYFGRTPVMGSSYNNVTDMTLDDYFVMHLYEGDIYKTANLQNKLLIEEAKGDSARLKEAQERVEGELKGFENNLWGIEEPDTTTVEDEAKATRFSRSKAKAEKPTNKAPHPKATTKAKSAPKAKAAPKASKGSGSASSGTLSVRKQKK